MSKNIEMQVLGESGYETIYPVVTTVIEQNQNLQQKFWRGTQAEYDAIQNKDANTMYIISDSNGEPLPIGNMLKKTYDRQNRNTDIFEYVDNHATNIPITSEPADNVKIWIDPSEEGDNSWYTKAETDGLLSGKADLDSNGKVPTTQLPEISSVKTLTGTIGTTWVENEDTGVKSQQVAITGILSTHTAKVDHDTASINGTSDGYTTFVEEENQYLTYITNGYAETYDGGIIFYIFGDAPTVSIPIVAEVA